MGICASKRHKLENPKQLETLERQLDVVTYLFKARNDQFALLAEELESKNAALLDSSSEISFLDSRMLELKCQYQNKLKAEEGLQNELQNSHASLEEQRKAAEIVNQENDAAQLALEQLRMEFEEQQRATKADFTERYDSLQVTVQLEKSELQTEVQQLRTTMKGIDQQLVKSRAATQHKEMVLQMAQSNLRAVTTKAWGLEQKRCTMSRELSDLHMVSAKTIEQLADAQSQIEGLKEKLLDANKAAEDTTGSLAYEKDSAEWWFKEFKEHSRQLRKAEISKDCARDARDRAKDSRDRARRKLKACKPSTDSESDSSIDEDYLEPFKFSRTKGKDLRIGIDWWDGEVRVDIREWYSNRRSKKGISVPVKDAAMLAKVLPNVVHQAKK